MPKKPSKSSLKGSQSLLDRPTSPRRASPANSGKMPSGRSKVLSGSRKPRRSSATTDPDLEDSESYQDLFTIRTRDERTSSFARDLPPMSSRKVVTNKVPLKRFSNESDEAPVVDVADDKAEDTLVDRVVTPGETTLQIEKRTITPIRRRRRKSRRQKRGSDPSNPSDRTSSAPLGVTDGAVLIEEEPNHGGGGGLTLTNTLRPDSGLSNVASASADSNVSDYAKRTKSKQNEAVRPSARNAPSADKGRGDGARRSSLKTDKNSGEKVSGRRRSRKVSISEEPMPIEARKVISPLPDTTGVARLSFASLARVKVRIRSHLKRKIEEELKKKLVHEIHVAFKQVTSEEVVDADMIGREVVCDMLSLTLDDLDMSIVHLLLDLIEVSDRESFDRICMATKPARDFISFVNTLRELFREMLSALKLGDSESYERLVAEKLFSIIDKNFTVGNDEKLCSLQLQGLKNDPHLGPKLTTLAKQVVEDLSKNNPRVLNREKRLDMKKTVQNVANCTTDEFNFKTSDQRLDDRVTIRAQWVIELTEVIMSGLKPNEDFMLKFFARHYISSGRASGDALAQRRLQKMEILSDMRRTRNKILCEAQGITFEADTLQPKGLRVERKPPQVDKLVETKTKFSLARLPVSTDRSDGRTKGRDSKKSFEAVKGRRVSHGSRESDDRLQEKDQFPEDAFVDAPYQDEGFLYDLV